MALSCLGMQDDPRLAGACACRLCAWSRLSERTQSDEAAGGRKARTAPIADSALPSGWRDRRGEPYRIASSVRSDGAEKTVWRLTARVRPYDYAQPQRPDPGRPRADGVTW